jgi:hypothetical protein
MAQRRCTPNGRMLEWNIFTIWHKAQPFVVEHVASTSGANGLYLNQCIVTLFFVQSRQAQTLLSYGETRQEQEG